MKRILLPIVLHLAAAGLAAAAPFATWGAESLRQIREDLWLPESRLYAEQGRDAKGQPAHPSFMWGVGVQLSALAAAARLQPDTYLAETLAYADEIQGYWTGHNGIAGFNVLPAPASPDRYYDDNAWLVLALSEVFELTRDPKYLDRAIATHRFVMSGADDQLGGGLYWRENPRESKNTCTNAPAIVSALRLHQLTKEPSYLESARQLYAWTNARLQDSDGLYWDNIRLDGRVRRQKFTYNSALMLRANCLFHEITGEARYLDEAKRIAAAAEARWVRDDGSIADAGRFAHLLTEAFLALHQRDRDPRWARSVEKSLTYVHDRLRTPQGRYPNRWDPPYRDDRPDESALLNQAAPARAFWMAADVIR